MANNRRNNNARGNSFVPHRNNTFAPKRIIPEAEKQNTGAQGTDKTIYVQFRTIPEAEKQMLSLEAQRAVKKELLTDKKACALFNNQVLAATHLCKINPEQQEEWLTFCKERLSKNPQDVQAVISYSISSLEIFEMQLRSDDKTHLQDFCDILPAMAKLFEQLKNPAQIAILSQKAEWGMDYAQNKEQIIRLISVLETDAVAHLNTGNLERAEMMLKKCDDLRAHSLPEALFTKPGELGGIRAVNAGTAINLAVIYATKDERTVEKEYLNKAIELLSCEEVEDNASASILRRRAQKMLILSDSEYNVTADSYKKSVQEADSKASELIKEIQKSGYSEDAVNNMESIVAEIEKLDCVDLYMNPNRYASLLMVMGDGKKTLGYPSQTCRYWYQKSLDVIRGIQRDNMPYEEISLGLDLFQLAHTFIEVDPEKASELQSQAIFVFEGMRDAKKLPSPDLLATAYYGHAETMKKLGDKEEARYYAEQAKQIWGTMINNPTSPLAGKLAATVKFLEDLDKEI